MKNTPIDIEYYLTGEDDNLFEEIVNKMRQEVARGKTFKEACEALNKIDKNLRPLIQDDALKIIVAEKHVGQGISIDDVALFLDLPYETVEASRSRIFQEFNDFFAHSEKNEISSMTH
ncbi:MAG: hypothetical protein ACQES8_00245 [Thermodesulfobacteriota bacterium]